MKKERFKKVLKAFKKRSFYVFIFCNLFATFLHFACNITVKVINKDENGKVISKEEKDYPEVGNYEMHFIYGNEVATIRVIVKDTTKPEIKAPTSIDIFQYTDLSTFSFDELLEVIDYSDVKDWIVDTSKIDVNTVGTYKLKVSIQDKYKNKASKKLKVNVV